MKIGIVTYHRTMNYGAVMQSLAMRFVLQKMGHEVYYVDYWPDYHRDKYKLFPVRKFVKLSLKNKVNFIKSLVLNHKSQKRRIYNFEKFFKTQIYPYCCSVEESFDVVIYGSDQIWRKQKELCAYNPFYFGDNKLKTNHNVAYAASMGILPNNDEDKAIVKALVTHLEKISVREEDLRQLLLSLGFANVSLTLDPTLLLSAEEWDKYLPTENYIGEKYKNAEYVFSASFHGLAFSIIYGKQFFASFVGNTGRAESLLNLIGIPERLLPSNSMIPEDMPPVNYSDVCKKLVPLREESLKFLATI